MFDKAYNNSDWHVVRLDHLFPSFHQIIVLEYGEHVVMSKYPKEWSDHKSANVNSTKVLICKVIVF
jgi:hypothetical protein